MLKFPPVYRYAKTNVFWHVNMLKLTSPSILAGNLYNWIVYKRGSKARERKGERKTSSTARSFMRSFGYVAIGLPSSTIAFYYFPPML